MRFNRGEQVRYVLLMMIEEARRNIVLLVVSARRRRYKCMKPVSFLLVYKTTSFWVNEKKTFGLSPLGLKLFMQWVHNNNPLLFLSGPFIFSLVSFQTQKYVGIAIILCWVTFAFTLCIKMFFFQNKYFRFTCDVNT